MEWWGWYTYHVYVSERGSKNGSGESRSQGSQNGNCTWRQNEESVTEHQGSPNKSLWELKWPLSACSGWPCRVLRLLRPSSGRAQDLLRHAQECSPSAQVKAAAAQVQTLKQNQRKKKLSLTFVVVGWKRESRLWLLVERGIIINSRKFSP
jgi:hypothetical protein